MDPHGGRQAADEDLFDSLVLAYDEALATGTVPKGIEPTGLTPEQASRLASAYDCLSLLEKARRDQVELLASGTNGKAPHPDGQQPEWEHQIGRFEIERELGRGGYGVVLLARDPVLNRRVALKVPRPEVLMTADLSRRFLREAQAAGSLQHPNLVAVYEVGQAGPVHYIASAYCQGPTLADWRERLEQVPVDSAVQIVAELADGVSAAHQHGILHRDIKPGNVLLEPRGDTATAALGQLPFIPKLTDFGLAKLGEYERDATRTGILLGTPAYMAPEQAAGKLREVGPATDIFALGAVLYELLTGRRAFQGASDVETLRLVAETEPRRPRQLRPEISRDLEAVCLKCLEKQPQRRYASTALLADDLRRCLAGKPTLARPLSSAQRMTRWARRQPAAAALAALSAGSVLLFIGVLMWHSATLSSALKVTQQQRDLAEQLRLEAAANGRLAAEQELIANQHLYALRMRLAHAAIEQGDAADGTRLLEMYQPPQQHSQLRGFEWAVLTAWLNRAKYVLDLQSEAYAVAFSPDGRVLATGNEKGLVAFWDSETGRRLDEFTAHGSCVNKLSYSPDGALLASGGCDNAVRLWSVAPRQEIAVLLSHDHFIAFVEFSPDGKQLAAIADDGLVVVWDVESRAMVHRIRLPAVGQWVSWSPDARLLAAGTTQTMQIWRSDDWSEHPTPAIATTAGTFMPDSQRLLTLSFSDHQLNLTDLNPSEDHIPILRELSVSSIPVISASGQRLALTPGPALIEIFDPDTLRSLELVTPAKHSLSTEGSSTHAIARLNGHRSHIKEMTFSPDETLLASASRDGTVRVWEPEKAGGVTPFVIPLHLSAASNPPLQAQHEVTFDRALRRVFVATAEGALTGWDITDPDNPQALPTWPANLIEPSLVALGPIENTLLVAHRLSGQLVLYDTTTGMSSAVAKVPGQIQRWTTSYNGATVATLTHDHVLRVHDVPDGNLRLECRVTESGSPLRPETLRTINFFLPPDDRLYTTRLDLLDLPASTNPSRPIEVRQANWGFEPQDYTPDGQFAAGLNLTELMMARNDSLEILCTARMAEDGAHVAISPDHKTIATLSTNRRVGLWNATTGQHLFDLDSVKDTPIILKFSADGTRLGAITKRFGTSVGHAYLWTINNKQ